MSEDTMDITPHLPPIVLTDISPQADGPAFEVWTTDYITKFGVVHQCDGLWIASANIEFPQPFRARDDAIAMLVLFRGKFPTPSNPDEEELADFATTRKGSVELPAHSDSDDYDHRSRVVFTVDHTTPAYFAVDEHALANWVDEHHDDLDACVPDDMHEAPASAVSDLVSDAVAARVLVGDPDLELQVNGDDDSDGSGFYVILHNRHGRQRMVGLTTGWTEFSFPDKHLPLIDRIRDSLDQVLSTANSLLILVAAQSRPETPAPQRP
ncbi:hypothetical protein [Nocardia arthritidis]|uniref:Uncharacterized protein n=1 Tax=Nocardia arthritidis TaxID=228602 RepID=A0A6G9Y9J5_9NOCA|nr:hypothetical protein [Nocardia arthritidis]QIS09899.1 hypothetical protein F5544_09995 [Nocardia arthritidis]